MILSKAAGSRTIGSAGGVVPPERLGTVDLELYGGRRGYLEYLRSRVLYALGAYRGLHEVDWGAISRLVFVCKGNICRSPYAAARARGLGVDSVSLGLEAADGAMADAAAARNALSRGLDLSAHRSARLESALVRNGDLIVVFEPAQLRVARQRCENSHAISLLGIWECPIRPHLEDPHGRSDRYFQQCFSIIDTNVAAIVSRLTKGDMQHT